MSSALVWSLVVIAVVAGVIAVVVGLRRRDSTGPASRPRGAAKPGRPGETGRPGKTSRPGKTGGTGPQPGEIWWADVPFEDVPGSKVRPCLVLRVQRGAADVLKITSQDQSDRADHVEIPTRSWDQRADHNSFLDLTDPYRLRMEAFERRAGAVDDRTWALVRGMHKTGAPSAP